MIRIRSLLRFVLEPKTYLWVDANLVRETPRAILIIFDSRKAWIPKAWISRLKRNENNSIKIKISEHRWATKFATQIWCLLLVYGLSG